MKTKIILILGMILSLTEAIVFAQNEYDFIDTISNQGKICVSPMECRIGDCLKPEPEKTKCANSDLPYIPDGRHDQSKIPQPGLQKLFMDDCGDDRAGCLRPDSDAAPLKTH